MRVLICGGRDFSDRELMHGLLDRLKPVIDVLIHGGAPGADIMAAEWAIHNDIATSSFPAAWAQHGRAAGPIRNRQMLTEGKPDVVFAFPGGRGTENMVRQALNAHILTCHVSPPSSRSDTP